MRNMFFGILAIVVITTTGCSAPSIANETRVNATSTDPKDKPIMVPQVNKTHTGSEEYKGTLHHGTGNLKPSAYSPDLGFLAEKQAAQYLSKTKIRVGYGSVVELKDNKSLPQPSRILGYEPDYIEASNNYVCWIYQSQGMGGPDNGEIIYAYNVQSGITTKLWSPAPGTNQQIMEFQLDANNLYYGVQSSNGDSVKIDVHHVELRTMTQNILTTSTGGKNDNVIEDFAVSDGYIAIVWTPGSHFLPDSGFNQSEPYTVTLNSLDLSSKRILYQGSNANSFDMDAKDGTWVWSDKSNGVECYSIKSNQTWNIATSASYVHTDGRYVWWKAIDTQACGGFDIKTQKEVKVRGLKNYQVLVSNGQTIFLTGNNDHDYYWDGME
ncbi:hypothetical protein [Alicyclobacillus acidoterrestris]|uniref:Uncharacterized protein n=1 Tax=Alicyclobacillus acidoterrestris (strain ATCC 49025 / DSM 3922 / CIP 106132 / NCIMB 13137 / GD3B) TaxID=1356854 RepID=T0D0T3_ALIAG|nr:hypothetical protein [Alicyclobacillus acidoterrestris]EPZ45137.1 hypothetical protein N007_10020 [Alicyclobacillus acidoterrestris ATCC 49025]UNO48419.1 hypothetical protein K1I37_17385 [Alicyclobacillus acidoterrestris]